MRVSYVNVINNLNKTYVEQQQNNNKEHQNTTHNKHMIKEFTPPGLRLLRPTSNGLGLSIMLKSIKKIVYNAQMLLEPAPISSKCSKMVI